MLSGQRVSELDTRPHGTLAAYRRHYRHGERPCEPVIERSVHVADWREGIDLSDIDLKVATITEDEAEVIRQRRLGQMRKILEEHGHSVIAPEPDEDGTGA